jgi:cytochrome c oxidase cbb3-type subunit 3/ubiquinol-cytochrome c reductase cytochrome c subunit
LANPVYIAIAGRSTIAEATAKGGPGSLMPAFAKSHGGFLTDAQVGVLADGIVQRWGRANALGGLTPPSYAPTQTGDAASGKAAFDSACARCHHAAESVQIIDAGGQKRIVGPVTEPDFLALISDQNLRSTILAGKPDEGMPDWRGTASQPLTDKQATDIVAWLSSQRKKATEQMRTQNAAPQGGKQ